MRRSRCPPPEERAERLAVVLHVLYLVFNEGYTASSGPDLHRVELTTEAIRLARDLHRLLPDDGEVSGLLALMLLVDARRAGAAHPRRRARPARRAGPLALESGVRSTRASRSSRDSLARAVIGTYQLQAAIAAVHDEAATADATDWPEIVALYSLLAQIAPNPMVALNQAVAISMVDGPGPASSDSTPSPTTIGSRAATGSTPSGATSSRWPGDPAAARTSYLAAARRTTSLPERRYLESRAARLAA